jgi:predicted NUDIX family NTP pyrophosphohydrolase
MRITAGFFLVRKDYKILICHPTKAKDTVWSIPKGMLDEGEDPISGAVRETIEEINVDVSRWNFIHRLSPVKYRKTKKELHAWALFESQNHFDFDEFDLKCNSNVPTALGGYPEMDDYKYATIEEARPLLHDAQVACLDELEKIIQSMTKTKK